LTEDHLEDPGIDERIIIKQNLKKWYGGGSMEWIALSQDRGEFLDYRFSERALFHRVSQFHGVCHT
jgi:hypothetical protein